jgi:hypothetical protein
MSAATDGFSAMISCFDKMRSESGGSVAARGGDA